MDDFESRLVTAIHDNTESDDTRTGYARSMGMVAALELYSGPERARQLLSDAGVAI